MERRKLKDRQRETNINREYRGESGVKRDVGKGSEKKNLKKARIGKKEKGRKRRGRR